MLLAHKRSVLQNGKIKKSILLLYDIYIYINNKQTNKRTSIYIYIYVEGICIGKGMVLVKEVVGTG